MTNTLTTKDAEVKKKFQSVISKTEEAIDALLHQSADNLSGHLSIWFNHLKKIIITQATELALHREIEEHIKEESITEANVADIFGRLAAFRQSIVDENAAMLKANSTSNVTTTTET